MDGLPVHPSMVGQRSAVVATPPQDRAERHTTHENILKFFDKNTYRRGVVPKTSGSPSVHGQNFKETIHVGGESCQKRPPTSEPSGSQASRAAKLPKTMTQEELVEKFKLAASLNGLSWDELAVTRTLLNNKLSMFHNSRGKQHQCGKHTTTINQSSFSLPAEAEIATSAPSSGASLPASSLPPNDGLDGQELSDEELAQLEAEVEAEMDKIVLEAAEGQQLQPGQVQQVVAQQGQVQGQQLQAGQVQPMVPQAGEVQGQQLQAGQVQQVHPVVAQAGGVQGQQLQAQPMVPEAGEVQGQQLQAGQVQQVQPVVAQAGEVQGQQLQAGQVQQVQPVVAQAGEVQGQQLQAGQVQQAQRVVAQYGQVQGQQLQAGQVQQVQQAETMPAPSIVPTPHTTFFGPDGLPVRGPMPTEAGQVQQAGEVQLAVPQPGQVQGQVQPMVLQAGQVQQVQPVVPQAGQVQGQQLQAGQGQQVVAQVGQHGQQLQAGQVQQVQPVVAQQGQVQGQQLQAGQVQQVQPVVPQAGQVQQVVAQVGQHGQQQVQPVVPRAGQGQSSPAALPALVDQAVATAADQAEKKKQVEAAGLATSSTHRSEYMAFLRAAKNPYPGLEWLNVTHIPSFVYCWWIQSGTYYMNNYYRLMAPTESNHEFQYRSFQLRQNMKPHVAAMFTDGNKKKDLFNLWLQHARDFGKVEVEITRRNIQRQSSHTNLVTWSRAQLEESKRYTKEDIDDLIARCEAKGSYMDDPNFPGVQRLRRYTFVDEVGAQKAHVREDSQDLKNMGSVSTAEALELTGAGLYQLKFQNLL